MLGRHLPTGGALPRAVQGALQPVPEQKRLATGGADPVAVGQEIVLSNNDWPLLRCAPVVTCAHADYAFTALWAAPWPLFGDAQPGMNKNDYWLAAIIILTLAGAALGCLL